MGGGTVRLVGKRRMVSVGGMLTALARDRAGLLSLLMGALLSFAGDGTGRLSPFCATGACGLWMAGYAPWPALVGGLAGSLFLGRYGAATAYFLYGALGMLWLLWRGDAQRPDKLLLLAAAHLLTLPFFYFESVDSCMLGLAQASLSLLCAPLVQRGAQALAQLSQRRPPDPGGLWGLAGLMAMAAMAGMAIGYQGIYLGCAIACFAAVWGAGAAGLMAIAAAAFVGAGAMLGGASLPFVGSLVLCTLCAAPAWRNRLLVSGLFLLSGGLCGLYIPGGENMLFYAALGAGGYLLLPGAATRLLRKSLQGTAQGEAGKQLAQCRRRVRDAAQVMERVAELLETSGQSQGERFAGRQLRSMGKALEELSANREPLPPAFTLSLGAAACPKTQSDQTGDSMAWREVDNLRLLLLSDGMGSGELAHRESAAAVALLGDLLSIGVEESAALECVNQLLMLKCQEDMYATLDVLLLDLSTCRARFLKQGAPPSYILRKGRVYAIHAETLPVGILPEAAPVCPQDAQLMRGDAVVMMTDGLGDALGQELLAAIIEGVGGANTPQDGADALLRRALERNPADDMSVIVARVE